MGVRGHSLVVLVPNSMFAWPKICCGKCIDLGPFVSNTVLMKQDLTLMPTRRGVLGTSLAAGAVVTLAACGGGKSSDTPPSATGTATNAIPLAELPVKGTASIAVNGKNYLLYRPDDKTVLAYTAVCTHQGCTVGTGDSSNFICPCHGSEYSKLDGSVTQGPAPKALTRYATSIEGDEVKIFL